MSEDQPRLFIIRKIKKVKKSHHGGSWKIAYADFVTAMMTFFLLLWLLSMMNKYQLEGIAEYFKKPLTDAFKHQGMQTNRDAKKDKGVAAGFDSEKQQKEDTNFHRRFKEISKSSQVSRAVGAYSETEAIGIQMQNMKPGIKVFGMDEAVKNSFSNTLSQAETIMLINQKQQNKSTPQIFNMSHLQSGQLMDKAGLATKDVKQVDAETMKKELEEKLEQDPVMRQFKNQLNFIVTADGLKIELRDLENKPMFSTGKTDFHYYSAAIISWLAQQLNVYSNRVVIAGHTDAAQYQQDDYSNWELSVDRANATRRELIKNGMAKEKIIRIIGLGDTELLDKSNGLNPSNRRIEILIMTDEALKRLNP